MKIMAIMAHPDDAEVWAGGTLAKHILHGGSGHIVILTYTTTSPRGREAMDAAEILGCTVELLGFEDTGLRDSEDASERALEALCRQRPRIVLVHHPDDTHPDHEAASIIARRAIIRWYSGARRPPEVPSVFAVSTYLGMGLRGAIQLDTFVDISPTWDLKRRALLAHRSQATHRWLSQLEDEARVLGARIGVRMAEGFKRLVLFNEPGACLQLDPTLSPSAPPFNAWKVSPG